MMGIKTPKKNDKKFSLDGLNSINNSGIFKDLRRLSFGPDNFNVNSKIKKDKITDIKVNNFDYEKKIFKNEISFLDLNKKNDLKSPNKKNQIKKKKFRSFFQKNSIMDDINFSREESNKIKIKKVNSFNYKEEEEYNKKEFGKENKMSEINKEENLKQNKFLEFSDLKEKKMLGQALNLNSSTISFEGLIETNNKEDLDQNVKNNQDLFEKQVNLDLKNKFNFFKKEDVYVKLAEFDIIGLIIKNGGIKIESEEELHTPELYRSGFKKKNRFEIDDKVTKSKNLFEISDKEIKINEYKRIKSLEKDDKKSKKILKDINFEVDKTNIDLTKSENLKNIDNKESVNTKVEEINIFNDTVDHDNIISEVLNISNFEKKIDLSKKQKNKIAKYNLNKMINNCLSNFYVKSFNNLIEIHNDINLSKNRISKRKKTFLKNIINLEKNKEEETLQEMWSIYKKNYSNNLIKKMNKIFINGKYSKISDSEQNLYKVMNQMISKNFIKFLFSLSDEDIKKIILIQNFWRKIIDRKIMRKITMGQNYFRNHSVLNKSRFSRINK